MRGPRLLSKREFLRRVAQVAALWVAGEFAVPALLRVNTVLFAKSPKAKRCKVDTCTTRDGCDGDTVGHRCEVRDVCDVDESGDCRVDECGADASGGCTDDRCDSDASGGCTQDECVSDSSGDCRVDECRTDSSGGCTEDRCASDTSKGCTQDECVSDATGECANDSCVADSSGGCDGDSCVSDKSGDCALRDTCVSDKSGNCENDACVADSSGECGGDACRSDSSKSCVHDDCTSDTSGECGEDACVADASGNCDADTCTSDSSGQCGGDDCVSDSSGDCTVRDSCVRDVSGACGSDGCRDDVSADCPASDTCSTDFVLDRPSGALVAKSGVNRALRWLYGLSAALLIGASGVVARGGTVIDVSDAAFVPAPTFETGKAMAVSSPAGPFLRDADADGILEADVNGDGSADGDPEVKDHDGDGTRELPPGTPFSGTLEFTCFHVPPDVVIVTTGPLTIRASVEVAVFGVVRVASGIEIACLGPIDTRTSAWIADGGSISFATALPGEVLDEPTGLVGDDGVGNPDYVSPCEATETTLRRGGPLEGTIGTEIALWVTRAGTKKGKVAIGTAKAKVLFWGPNFVICAVKKTPKTGIGTYALTVRPKEPKKAPLLDVPGGFAVRGPVVETIEESLDGIAEPDSGGDEWTVQGQFFGVKRGRITLDGKRCRVTRWTMNRSTGESEARFLLPPGLEGGVSYTLAVTNKVGSATGSLQVATTDPDDE